MEHEGWRRNARQGRDEESELTESEDVIQTIQTGQFVRSSPGYMLNFVVRNIESRDRDRKLETQTFSFEESKEHSDSVAQHDPSIFPNFEHHAYRPSHPSLSEHPSASRSKSWRSRPSLYMRIQNISPMRMSWLRFVQPRVRLRRQLLSHPHQKHVLSLFVHIRGLEGSFFIAVLD